MIKHIKIGQLMLLIFIATNAIAGNKDRVGQASAGELLLNPWSRSSGLFGLNAAHVKGMESMRNNIAGLAHTKNTEIGVAHTRYLAGAGMGISNVGVAKNVGELGVVGVNIMSFGFGEIPITTENSPTGGLGNFKPSFLNITLGLGHTFSDNMCAGISLTYVNEAIHNLKASAVGIDAGVQYTNGPRDNFHIGIGLRNVGSNIRFSGDGLSYNTIDPGLANEITANSRSEKFTLPTQLNIATSYDFYLNENKTNNETVDKDETMISQNRLTTMISFISNAYNSDWLGIGAEYAYKEKFMARLGYRYESKILNKEDYATVYTGLSAGIGFKTHVNKNKTGPQIAIDYAYKMTRISYGVHVLGLTLNLSGKKDE